MHAIRTSTYSPESVARIATRSPLATPDAARLSASRLTRLLVSANVRRLPSSNTKQARSGARSAESSRKSPARVIGRSVMSLPVEGRGPAGRSASGPARGALLGERGGALAGVVRGGDGAGQL